MKMARVMIQLPTELKAKLDALRYQGTSISRLRYLSGEANAERLLQACDVSLRPIVLTALHTGMRKRELLGLTWDCVDMTHGSIRLKKTKNGKARALPFNETLWSLFSQLLLIRLFQQPPNCGALHAGDLQDVVPS